MQIRRCLTVKNLRVGLETNYYQKLRGRQNFLKDCIKVSDECLFHLYLMSRESDGDAIFLTNPHSLRSYRFPSFPIDTLTSSQLICYLFEAPKHQTEIIVVKRLIQGRNNAMR